MIWEYGQLTCRDSCCGQFFCAYLIKTLHRLANRKQRKPPGPAEGRSPKVHGVVLGVFWVRMIGFHGLTFAGQNFQYIFFFFFFFKKSQAWAGRLKQRFVKII
jgi:hypothetical protein